VLINPVPDSLLGRYLDDEDEVSPFLPQVEPPFALAPPPEQIGPDVESSICAAAGRSLLVVSTRDLVSESPNGSLELDASPPGAANAEIPLPRGTSVSSDSSFAGIEPLVVTELEIPADACR
jgi:hypothetical protein